MIGRRARQLHSKSLLYAHQGFTMEMYTVVTKSKGHDERVGDEQVYTGDV
jgi:hypothetical protein